MLEEVLEYLETCDLPATVYRTAVRLARLAAPGGVVRLSYEQMVEIVGSESDATMRSHLVQLHRAGVLWYRRNAAVSVSFYARAERSNRALSDQFDRSAITEAPEDDAPRALSDQFDRSAITEAPEDDAPRALSDQFDRSAINSRAERSKRALSDHPNKVGRKVGRKDQDQPTYLPGGVGGMTETQARTLRLLTDPDVGMNDHTAAALALKYPFDQVLAQVFGVLADVEAGKVGSVYVLPSRLQRGGTPRITEADRASSLYRRHVTEDEEAQRQADENRKRYIPDEYADVILG